MSKHKSDSNSKANDSSATATAATSSTSMEESSPKSEEGAAAAPSDQLADDKDSNEDKPKKNYDNWPMKQIKEPHENDVMYGRGGGTNHHPGNKRYRKLVEDRKVDYVNSKRLDKPLVALEIIRQWRGQEPPGRFLKLDEKSGLWNDVGDKKAREKTSQALREKAPIIRKQQEEKRMGKDGKPVGVKGKKQDDGDNKSTRFAEGTKTEAQQAEQVKRPMLARDHSLGREFLPEGDNMAIDNFSWQDPFQSSRSISFSSMGSLPGIAAAIANANGQPGGPAAPSHPNAPPPPPPHAVYGPPAGRTSSHGSMGMHPPYHTSVGGPPPHHQTHPPPPPDYYGRVASGANEDRRRNFSGGRYESWGSIGSLSSLPPYPGGAAGPPAQGPAPPPGTAYGGPPGGPGGPPPPPPPGAFAHQRSGSWTQGPPFPPPSRGATHQRSGSWSHGREHSLMMNPLTGASTTHPATPFDGNGHMGGGRSASGYWGRNPPPPGAYAHSPSASRHHPAGPYRESSNTMSPYGARSPGSNNTSPKAPNIIPPARNGAHTGPPPAGSTTPTPNYNVDMNIAKTWSGGGEIRKTWSNEEASGTGGDGNRASPSRASWGRDQYQKPLSDEVVVGGRSTDVSPLRDSGAAIMPKPNMVKRDTSHQNESYETKPSIKRAALNRDQSATSNRLKQQYVPELFNGNKSKSIAKFDREMRMLSNDLEYTNIKEPSRIDNNGAPKPKRLGETDRLSTLDTVDKITLELMDKPPPLLADNRTSTIDALDLDLDESFPPARPPALKDENRLSTMDFLDMVNTPLQEEIEGDGNNDNAPLTLADESVANEWLGKV